MIAKLIKELRQRTGAGFLDSKKALEASGNDIEKSIIWLKERGQAKAVKKAGAIAAEGLVGIVKKDSDIVIYEVNSQTDFVAKNTDFLDLFEKIGQTLISNSFSSHSDALNLEIDSQKISDVLIDATAKIGEKIALRRAQKVTLEDDQVSGTYVHTNGQIASIFIARGEDLQAAKNVSMHIASMNPTYLKREDIPKKEADELKKEILNSDNLQSKPEKMRDKIADGMLSKKMSEFTLLEQEFVVEKGKVSSYLESHKLSPVKMIRYQVGEGIEKSSVDFANEVQAQIEANKNK